MHCCTLVPLPHTGSSLSAALFGSGQAEGDAAVEVAFDHEDGVATPGLGLSVEPCQFQVVGELQLTPVHRLEQTALVVLLGVDEGDRELVRGQVDGCQPAPVLLPREATTASADTADRATDVAVEATADQVGTPVTGRELAPGDGSETLGPLLDLHEELVGVSAARDAHLLVGGGQLGLVDGSVDDAAVGPVEEHALPAVRAVTGGDDREAVAPDLVEVPHPSGDGPGLGLGRHLGPGGLTLGLTDDSGDVGR